MLVAITGGVVMRWQREACGAKGGSAAVGLGAGPATPVREERDQDHCMQVGCVLSWLVRNVLPLLAGGRKLSWRERRASRRAVRVRPARRREVRRGRD